MSQRLRGGTNVVLSALPLAVEHSADRKGIVGFPSVGFMPKSKEEPMPSPKDHQSPPAGPVWDHEAYDTRGKVVAEIPALRAFARTFCRRPEDADDLVQETLLKALKNLHRYEPETRLKSWLFTIMRNSFCTRAVRSKREVVGITPAQTAQMVTPANQEHAARLEEIKRALFRLPPNQREILTLVVVMGEPYEVAAEICNCAVGTVKSRLSRARRQLCVELGEVADGDEPVLPKQSSLSFDGDGTGEPASNTVGSNPHALQLVAFNRTSSHQPVR